MLLYRFMRDADKYIDNRKFGGDEYPFATDELPDSLRQKLGRDASICLLRCVARQGTNNSGIPTRCSVDDCSTTLDKTTGRIYDQNTCVDSGAASTQEFDPA